MGNDPTLYVQIFRNVPHVNWDAALTLGTCGIVIARVSAYPIGRLYVMFAKPRLPWYCRALMAAALTITMPLGITAAVILLGVWSSVGLHALGYEQGVSRPYTSVGLVPAVNQAYHRQALIQRRNNNVTNAQ